MIVPNRKNRGEPQVLHGLQEPQAGWVSAQILAELLVTITRRVTPPLSISDAMKRIEQYSGTRPLLDVTDLVVLEAARGVRDHQFSYWDAQIWATARLNQISCVFSEDFTDGVNVEGVRFLNPFVPAFDLRRVIAFP